MTSSSLQTTTSRWPNASKTRRGDSGRAEGHYSNIPTGPITQDRERRQSVSGVEARPPCRFSLPYEQALESHERGLFLTSTSSSSNSLSKSIIMVNNKPFYMKSYSLFVIIVCLSCVSRWWSLRGRWLDRFRQNSQCTFARCWCWVCNFSHISISKSLH